MNKRVFYFIYFATIILFIILMAGFPGLIYLMGYIAVIAVILKFVKRDWIKVMLMIMIIIVMLLLRFTVAKH